MLTKWCRAFQGMPEEVPHARHFVASLLADRGPVEDAVLVVSELATNALRHTLSGSDGGRFFVIVGLGDDVVRIEVVDQGGELVPHLCHATDREEGGRGLRLIAAFAKNWGYTVWRDGRSVWAELARASA
ncbi:ATP-binding protein [Streptomyces argyrophyllae]|uniref:ATP-binding protein n=1 Tax=Streptomyces argyrophylli TaxID=2726118 RepID=A0A6M4PM51_9ACTN|nr:ATP-binding protein [Streptomyces argyrophyllae]QJS10000.1 ATP-binding protein [Streptomyces argyrophyllae]